MRYFYDCEFLEDGRTIELISIGIVADDGREYYAVNRDFHWRRIAHRQLLRPWRWTTEHQWLADFVVPSLPKFYGDAILHYGNEGPLGRINWQHRDFKSLEKIARDVQRFLLAEPKPELWAYYAAYDHVALCQLWGRMIDLPEGVPMFTRDIKQEAERLGNPKLPEQAEGEHNALADARHNKVMFDFLAGYERRLLAGQVIL